MRFIMFDQITRIEKGKMVEAVKTFSLAEECHRHHFSRTPFVPGALVIETMAQVLGCLINYSHDFKRLAIMSLLEGVHVPSDLKAGGVLRVRAELVSTSSRDSIGRAWIECGEGIAIARADRIIYTHWQNIDSEELIKWTRYYNGGRDLPPDGCQIG